MPADGTRPATPSQILIQHELTAAKLELYRQALAVAIVTYNDEGGHAERIALLQRLLQDTVRQSGGAR